MNEFVRNHVVFAGEALVADLAKKLFLLELLLDARLGRLVLMLIFVLLIVAFSVNQTIFGQVSGRRGQMRKQLVGVRSLVAGIVGQLSVARLFALMNRYGQVLHLSVTGAQRARFRFPGALFLVGVI